MMSLSLSWTCKIEFYSLLSLDSTKIILFKKNDEFEFKLDLLER